MFMPLANPGDSRIERWIDVMSRLTRSNRFAPKAPLADPSHATSQDSRIALCVYELERLHTVIFWHDTIVMNKKSWFIAVWSLVSSFGLYQGRSAIVLLGLAVVAGFALSEFVLRRYQRRYVVRAEEVERVAASGDLGSYRFGLSTTPARTSRVQEVWYALSQPHFTLFYGFFAVASVVCAWLVGMPS